MAKHKCVQLEMYMTDRHFKSIKKEVDELLDKWSPKLSSWSGFSGSAEKAGPFKPREEKDALKHKFRMIQIILGLNKRDYVWFKKRFFEVKKEIKNKK